jgi:hypothetical protein
MNKPAPADRFAIVPLFPNQSPPAHCIAWGNMDAVMERIVDSNTRNDAIDLIHDAAVALGQLERTRNQQAQIFARSFQDVIARLDALAHRMDAIEEQRAARAKADAEEEQQRIQDYLDSLPDPDNLDGQVTYDPSGELHILPPTISDQGALPNELVRKAPPETGNYPEPDPSKLAHPQQQPAQPVAISLN